MREWLSAQAARGYVSYDGAGDGDGLFSLPDEHAVPLTDETSAGCVIGAFEIAIGSVYATDTIAERFRTGDGFAWGAHDEHVLGGCERFFRPGYLNHLAGAWIPALDGVEAKLTAGARIADVGCGHGASTLLLAETYPASTVVGFDAHDGSIDAARKRAADAGLADRVRFEVASSTTFTGTYDLVCFFDCLHDMGDPAGACAHVRDHLAPDGTLMLIEPFANDDLADNLNPVGAAYYGFSTLLCTPCSLVARGRHRARRPGRRGPTARNRHRRRFQNRAPGRGNAVQHRARGKGRDVMKFAQIIEFTTSRIDDFNAKPRRLDDRVRRSSHPASSGSPQGPRRRERLPAHGRVLVLRTRHGELEPPRDRRVRRVPHRDQRRRADVPEPRRAAGRGPLG